MPRILLYIISCLLSTGCIHKTGNWENTAPALYAEPLVVSLNTNEGYAVNGLTGDSVKPLVNEFGKIIPTGVPYSMKGIEVEQPGMKHPKMKNDDSPLHTNLEANEHILQGNPESEQVNPQQLTAVAISPDKDSIIIDDSNYILLLHKKISVTTKIVPLNEPQPVKIQPMRYKDNALFDIQYLDIEQGLPYSYIYATYHDKEGNLWMGTDYGLCKYDGTYLTTYTEKNGLINNKVYSIAEDNSGRLWIGTYAGITVFNGNSFLQFGDNENLLLENIQRIKKDSKGNMIFIVEAIGVLSFNGTDFHFYSSKNNFSKIVSPEIIMDDKGLFWLPTPGGVVKQEQNKYLFYNPRKPVLNTLIDVACDRAGNTWFVSGVNGITRYDGKTFMHYTNQNGLADNLIMTMLVDSNDQVWIGTRYSGISKFDGVKFTNYNDASGLSENKIHNLAQDKEGNIWIGTLGGGINKLNEKGFAEKIPLSKLNNSRVRPILKDKTGSLWFGTEDGGLYSYDGTSLLKHLTGKDFSISGFRSAWIDKEKNLWFGEHEGSGMYKYDYKNFFYYEVENKISSNLSLFRDSQGIIWIGTTREGVAAFNGSTNMYYNKKTGFPSNRVFVTIKDKKGNLWFGTEGSGLVKYDGKLFTVYSEKQGLFCKSITSIIEDEKGNLWLGTLEAGLCRFDGKSFMYYTQKQGLAFNAIWSLKQDASKRIWVGTDNGLSVLVPQQDTTNAHENQYKIYSFGLEDGLKATDFNLNGVCIDNENRIWWGTGKALITKDLNLPLNTGNPQSVKLSFIEVNDQFVEFSRMKNSSKTNSRNMNTLPFQNNLQNLTLPYHQNHLTFHFSAIDWMAPHKRKYSYRLIGLDEKWSTPSAEPLADYRNLTFGTYEFQVMAIGQSQVWTKPLTYTFEIKPAWWQTLWFKIVIVLLSMAFTFLVSRSIYRARLRKQKQELEKQLAVQMERQRISSEMHDDIGAGLSGVRLLTEMTKNKLKETEATGDINKIYESVGEIAAKMKEVIWSLNTENDSLSSLIAYLQKQARQLMEHYPGRFSVSLPERIPDTKISGEVRRQIYLSVKEALHNVIKHSGATSVELKIECNENLSIQIADNGKGLREDENSSFGNGLKNMRKRMEQVNGRLILKNDNGLSVIFELPLNSTS